MIGSIKLSTKVMALSAAIIAVFSLAVVGTYFIGRNQIVQMRHDEVHQQVETAYHVLGHFARAAADGKLPQDVAQQQAKEAIKRLRYGKDGYFWINDLQPRMVMHPTKPELDGQDLAGKKDPDGKPLFVAFVDVAKSKGEGFVEYGWPKPGSEKPVEKISYVKLLPEWGWIVGTGLYVGDLKAELMEKLLAVLGTLAAIAALALAGSWIVGNRISAAMAKTVNMLRELEMGHLEARLNLRRKDEIGQMAAAMDSFADSLQNEMVADLRRIADGDLSYSISPRDGRDEVRRSLQTVGENLSGLLGEVQEVAAQIASGSDQVAQGSQSLADSATHQASSIEEISASIAELASRTKFNADNASQANALAAQARSSAERGNSEMTQMVQAMAEVNEAGRNIGKIIKVIDEIAFQTNLLALNAAVEAARAGVHGKGFAVVAEEVRNLAARSAKAAKETADLIAGSVTKAENGAQLADRTAAALQEIVQDVTKVSDLVGEIAAASGEQAQGIAQVNLGLDQIDQTTQQNTGTAEESAAAAEVLHGQAAQLRDLLKRFRLKGEGAFAHSAPASKPRPAQKKIAAAPKAAAPGFKAPSPKGAASPSASTWGGVPSPAPRSASGSAPSAVIALDDEEFGKY